jgi:hypothetical protein
VEVLAAAGTRSDGWQPSSPSSSHNRHEELGRGLVHHGALVEAGLHVAE